uniref:Tail protein n=1 Tax=Siphoviridae sp. ctDXA22 TaxID=2826198 RepID=A0A8S5NQ97_9CAUD|nr:MAG TPA: tail protein [Siphoviridae sp. ctDXA22]
MQPILYETADYYKNPTALLESNGFGFLNECTEFLTTMEQNGTYSFSAKIKSTDKLVSKIKITSYIKAKVNNVSEPQYFYVTKIEVDKNGDLTVSGEHVSRMFFQNGTIPRAMDGSMYGTPKELIDHFMRDYSQSAKPLHMWFTDVPYRWFNFNSSIVTKKTISLGYSQAVKFEEIFKNDDEGLINQFGGVLFFDNFNIHFEKITTAGAKSGYRIAFGANVSDFKQSAEIGNYYTHVMPYARCSTTDKDEVVVSSFEPYETGLKRSIKNTYLYDCTSKIKRFTLNPSTGENYEEVRDALRNAVADYNYSTEQTAETLSIKVTLENELTKMHAIKLYDEVTVVMPDGTNLNRRISKTVYDSVSQKYKEITIGDLSMSMSDLLKIQRRFKK